MANLLCRLGQAHMVKKNISDFPPWGQIIIFVTEFVIFLLSMKQNELEENGFHMEEFQKYFSRLLFSIIFWPQIVILDTDLN